MATLNGKEYSGPGWSVPPELWPTAVTKGRNRWDTTPKDSDMTDSIEDDEPLGIEVEFDTAYTGGDYDGVGEVVWVPCALIERFDGDVPTAFQKLTGIAPLHIVHYSDSEVPECDDDMEAE